ncbi:hypothetical protein C8R46DRAFT_183749 [Mycena filopes]|nr:hypothetical protein C8R46DRAFT_183749 [Mycena filopes]
MAENTQICLPPELERAIFELAAWHHPETRFTLILVAKKVCIWIEPEIYHVLLASSGYKERILQITVGSDVNRPEWVDALRTID